jgi:hypothetical protein
METTTRNASLEELHQLLSVQHDAKHDAVVPASKLWYRNGQLRASGMGPDGPPGRSGLFQPTEIFDGHIADALKIPLAYVRRMRKDAVSLLDHNVNHWLHSEGGERNFFVRTFLDTHTQPEHELGVWPDGIARALLSDRYKRVDNLDVITAVLTGLRNSGIDARVSSCAISERRMQVRVVAPQVMAYADDLVAGYRDPFGHDEKRKQRRKQWSARTGVDIDAFGDSSVVFAGFVVTNSETGDGAASIWPQILFATCINGQTFSKDVLRNIHLGAQLGEGVVEWSDETQQKNLELIQSMTTDAVGKFLSHDYVSAKIDELSRQAGIELDNPEETVKLVGNQLKFTEEQIAGVFNHFIRGGQVTAGGVMQAITSYAQDVEDPDVAWELELAAGPALNAAASHALAARR